MDSQRTDRIAAILGANSPAESTADAVRRLEEQAQTPDNKLKSMVSPFFAEELQRRFQRPKLAVAKSVDEAVAVANAEAYWNGIDDIITFIASIGDIE